MAAYFVAQIRFGDASLKADYDEYVRRVKPVVESLGGAYLVRSEKIQGFFGTDAPDRVIVIRFADADTLQACFASEAYRAIAPLREQSVSATAFMVED